jgi:hypothetical protein
MQLIGWVLAVVSLHDLVQGLYSTHVYLVYKCCWRHIILYAKQPHALGSVLIVWSKPAVARSVDIGGLSHTGRAHIRHVLPKAEPWHLWPLAFVHRAVQCNAARLGDDCTSEVQQAVVSSGSLALACSLSVNFSVQMCVIVASRYDNIVLHCTGSLPIQMMCTLTRVNGHVTVSLNCCVR